MKGHDENNPKDFYRIFFALLLDDIVKETLIKLTHSLKKSSLCHYVNWKKIEKLHITVHFIGKTSKEKIPSLITSVQKKISVLPTFNLEFMHLSAFPPTKRPHVLVLNIHPSSPLLKLAETIVEGATEAEIPREKRPFLPHLTPGKFKKLPPATQVYPRMTFPILAIKEVVLLKSVQTESGVVYEIIKRLRLNT